MSSLGLSVSAVSNRQVCFVFRCNFALMLLAELVLDQASVDWEKHLPLMLHVIFLGEFTLAFSWFNS